MEDLDLDPANREEAIPPSNKPGRGHVFITRKLKFISIWHNYSSPWGSVWLPRTYRFTPRNIRRAKAIIARLANFANENP